MDIGCGHGSYAFVMADLNANVLAIDTDKARLKIAQEFNNHKNIKYSSLSLEKIKQKI